MLRSVNLKKFILWIVMHISSLFLACLPDHTSEVACSLQEIEGIEIQLQEDSKFILTLEAEEEKSAEITIHALEQIPHVVSVQLTGFCVEPE